MKVYIVMKYPIDKKGYVAGVYNDLEEAKNFCLSYLPISESPGMSFTYTDYSLHIQEFKVEEPRKDTTKEQKRRLDEAFDRVMDRVKKDNP